ncbi:MAG: GNAT family N-acetyltransferase [Deltaproteobacteria bacterium]|nr:GNAT family N-acetyltransferase [Deltaproteobacteria bacterium]
MVRLIRRKGREARSGKENNIRVGYLPDNKTTISTLAAWHNGMWPHGSIEYRKMHLRSQVGSRDIPTTFVAMSGKTLLGSASLVRQDLKVRPQLSPWMATVFVAPKYRKYGVGSALVKQVVQEAGRLNKEALYLFTPDKEKFYLALGWSVIERIFYRGEQQSIMKIHPKS